MRDLLRILLVYLPHNQGIILQQGGYKALIGMDDGADGDYFKVCKYVIPTGQWPFSKIIKKRG
jgi:hypothetical protein